MNHMNEKIKKKLDAARAELLDLGRRNPLINYKTFKARGVEIVDELSRHIYQILVHDNKAMSFLPATDLEDEKLMFTDDKAEKDPARYTDSKLQTSHAAADLQKRLMATYRLARTSIEEQGVNTLYLALGMLEWYESKSSDIATLAPLVLIPVRLDRTSVRARFSAHYTGEEIGTNLSLRDKLRKEFSFDLPNFSEESNQSVINYFQSVRKEIENFKRWKVDENKIALGFFSFAKLLMYRDLDADNWHGKTLPQHNVLSSLLDAPFQEANASISDKVSNIDKHLPATMVNHVVDADSSQALAIHDVSQGRNLIIQGPPGTGKSQTITNIIAEAIAEGKRVLFVAEKMAALEVVKRNLDAVGLGHACLELHSNKANKEDVIDELIRSLEIGEKNSSALDHAQLEDRRNVLNDYCKAINSPIGESGETTYRLYGKLLQLQKRLEKVDIPPLTYQGKYSASAIEQAVAQAKRLQQHLKDMGSPKKHPFWGCKKLTSSRDMIRRTAGKAKEATAELKKSAELLAEHVKINAPDNVKDIRKLLDNTQKLSKAPKIAGIKVEMAEWLTHRDVLQQKLEAGKNLRSFHKEYDGSLISTALSQNILEVCKILEAYRQRWWRFLSYKYHCAHAKVASLCKRRTPSSLDNCICVAKAIINAQQAQQQVAYMRETGQRLFGTHWQGEASDWSYLQEVTTYLSTIHKSIEDGESPKASLAYLAENPDLNKLHKLLSTVERWQKDYLLRLQQILEEIQLDEVQHFGKAGLKGLSLAEQVQILERWELEAEKLQDIAIYNDLIKELESSGFVIKKPESSSFVDVVAIANDWPDASEFLSDVLEYTYYDGLLTKAKQEYPILTRFSGASHQDNVERFKELDSLSLKVNRVKIANQHRQNLFQNIDASDELHIIKREDEKKCKHRPIRKLMLDAGNAIQIIKPVFMMSPLSVAEFLPPGKISFDMVIFDEASQVKPIDAYGAIIRGKQAIVIGDQHQLPPTDFFSKHIADDDTDESEENVAADIESILGLFNAQNAPQRMLQWHYRSRHESLIALSNKEFYQNKLLLFPSPDAEKSEVGLVYHPLPNATYDRGKSSTNLEEAKEVAKKVMEHANKHSQRTLGVVTFSVAQMNAIEAQLEILRRNDSSHEQTFFNTHGKEPFFIKNLENVQGDERDVIFISVGYGRDSNGKVTMNFGPLSRDGGERRLNVIITRARQRCEVFTNISADDIDLSRSKGRGIEVLKNYLEYAETGKLTDSPKPTGEADSPFEEEVANALRQRGYEVDHQIGSAGYFIDLGIKDPQKSGRYILGIECDGATYHSAKSARDRDRLRQLVLERQGWHIHRIWSTDWFNCPQREIEKAVAAIKKAELSTDAQIETPVKNSDNEESET